MFNFIYLYVVQSEDGRLVGLFKKKSNAIDAMPETKRNFPKQTNNSCWKYGEVNPWTITYSKILDSNDLDTSNTK